MCVPTSKHKHVTQRKKNEGSLVMHALCTTYSNQVHLICNSGPGRVHDYSLRDRQFSWPFSFNATMELVAVLGDDWFVLLRKLFRSSQIENLTLDLELLFVVIRIYDFYCRTGDLVFTRISVWCDYLRPFFDIVTTQEQALKIVLNLHVHCSRPQQLVSCNSMAFPIAVDR